MNWLNCVPIAIDPNSLTDDDIVNCIKAWRKAELTSCDWTQLPDVDLANKWDWAVYRQQLRDMPSQGDDPKLWVFPVSPT